MTYEIHLQSFDGPFDLLLHLIDKNQVDIYDIPIAEITAQYLAYLDEMERFDLEVASSFLLMAANLLAIKARMLLPQNEQDGEEEVEDARDELVHDLLEYLRFKEAAKALADYARQEAVYCKRPNEAELYLNLFSEDNPLEGKTLQDLTAAFGLVVKRLSGRLQVLEVARSPVTVKEKLADIRFLLRNAPKGLLFADIFTSSRSRVEMVVTFLALLELIHNREVKVRQEGNFEDIYIFAA